MAEPVAITAEGEEAVTATTTETIVQVRGVTTGQYEVTEIGLSADYEPTGADPEIVFWELLYQTTDGTATGATEVGRPDGPTPAITGFHTFTAEPTGGNGIRMGHFPAAGGEMQRYWADGDGPKIDDATSSRIGLRVTTTVNCNVTGYIVVKPVAV